MKKVSDLNEQLRRYQYTGAYWQETSTMIVQELYAIRLAMKQRQWSHAELKMNYLLLSLVEEGDKRNTVIEFVEGLIAFHALPQVRKVVSK